MQFHMRLISCDGRAHVYLKALKFQGFHIFRTLLLGPEVGLRKTEAAQ